MGKPKATNEAETQADAITGAAEAEASTVTQDELVQLIATDEHAGKGGSYTYDPKTNQRTKAEG